MKTMINSLIFVGLLTTVGLADTSPKAEWPVIEGFLAAGVEGHAVSDADGNWIFIPDADITDNRGKLSADVGVPLLACSTLEQMIQLAGEEQSIDVQLWAMATVYRGENYLFSVYFLPMRQAEKAEPAAEKPKATDERESILPSQIRQMMDRNAVPDLRRLDELDVVSQDRNLISRTGLMEHTEDGFVFVPDGFGQNISNRRYRLLPCSALEVMRHRIRQAPGRLRFVVSGVITEFDGQTYLLLRRAVRTYTHGNFTP